MLIKCRYTVGIFLFLFSATLLAQIEIPTLSQRITDLTNTLLPEGLAALEKKLADFETRKGSQIAVLILPTTEPEDIAAFGIRVADSWKIGRKNIDDGIILIVAKDDRKLRIEVGRGLEGVIPDAVAKRIITEQITPLFKKGSFAKGINKGVDWLMKLIDGEPLPAPNITQIMAKINWNNVAAIAFGLVMMDTFCNIMFGRFQSIFITGISMGVIIQMIFPEGYFGWTVSTIVIIAFVLGIIGSLLLKMAIVIISNKNFCSGSSSSNDFSRLSSNSPTNNTPTSSSGSYSGSGGSFSGGGASGSW